MNKIIKTILTTAAIVLATGRAAAGTWVNGCYVDGPLCTVCDGMKIVTHAYGTTVCTHCDGTGIEPPEETVVVENVIVDAWHPAPPPHHRHHAIRRPAPRPNPPRHVGRGRPQQHRTARPATPHKGGGMRKGRR